MINIILAIIFTIIDIKDKEVTYGKIYNGIKNCN